MTTSHLALGNQALKANDFDRALQHYRAAQSAHPALAHLLKANIELVERRLRAAPTQGREQTPAVSTTIDIVVPVFNALEDVKRCLASLEQHTDGMRVRVIVVNDGSDADTTQWLRAQCQGKPLFTLIEHAQNQGYTRAVNTGLRASAAEFVITQNSDTIVTPGWLQGMVRCMVSHPKIGVVGPLSNAASWQNVPQLRDASGNFAVNELPNGMTPEAMAALVARVSQRHYPRLPFVNGFCFMIRRAVIDAIGYMDEENFPVGYGEENDFCIRAIDAGFELAIADDVFVFHAKSKSFGHERRKTLSEQGTRSLKHKHTPEKYAARVEAVKRTEALDAVRARIQAALAPQNSADAIDLMSMRVLFLLPVKGGGGGAHSVVQEVTEMRRLGIHARVAVKHEQVESFLKSYADIPGAENTFVGFDDHSLIDLAEDYDVVVGTIFTSMKLVKRIVDVSPHILPAYYVQDYEPLFFEEGTPQWHEARESYTLVPGAFLFAKTQWIIEEVKRHHGVTVHKVQPSIDHEVYKPARRVKDGRLHVTAMIRPQTPRRGAARTMRLFARLHQAFGDRIQLHTFGCESDHPEFLKLERNFPFQNHGPLMRPQVAALLAQSDLFIDLSDYQAFGRTGLEAMACGCAAVVPAAGGANEYAVHNVTAVVVETFDEESTYSSVLDTLRNQIELQKLKIAGLVTASGYSIHRAAVSELIKFDELLSKRTKPKCSNTRSTRVQLILAESYPEDFQTQAHTLLEAPLLSTTILKRHRISTSRSIIRVNEDCETFVFDLSPRNKDYLSRAETARGLIQKGKKVIAYIEHGQEPLASWEKCIEELDHLGCITIGPLSAPAPRKTQQVILQSLHQSAISGQAPKEETTTNNNTEQQATIGIIGPPQQSDELQNIEIALEELTRGKANISIEWVGVHQDSNPRVGRRIGLPKTRTKKPITEWLIESTNWNLTIILPAKNNPNQTDRLLTDGFLTSNRILIASDTSPSLEIGFKTDFVERMPLSSKPEVWIQSIKRHLQDIKAKRRKSRNLKPIEIYDTARTSTTEAYLKLLDEDSNR